MHLSETIFSGAIIYICCSSEYLCVLDLAKIKYCVCVDGNKERHGICGLEYRI